MKFDKINSSSMERLTVVLFIALSVWWVIIALILKNQDINQNLYWAASYQILAILGAIFGIIISQYWGGFKSTLGKSIIFFSLGLLLQSFGQSVFSFYNIILKVEIPYPSIADIGFFGSVPLYIYGGILFGQASGIKFSLRSLSSKAIAIIIPLVILVASYFFFLKNYEFNLDNPLKVFLDFGYPSGQAIYISVAISTYFLSKKLLGGIMKNAVLLILIALVVQYVADYNFLYQTLNTTWINGGYGDFIYLIAYFVMALGLIKMGSVFNKIKELQ